MNEILLKLLNFIYEKNSALTIFIVGIVGLYVLGFNAENLVHAEYGIFALIIVAIIINISCFFSYENKVKDINHQLENIDDIIDDIEHMLVAFNTFVDLLNDIIPSIQKLSKDMNDLKNMLTGVPNKSLLKTLIILRTKVVVYSFIELFLSYITTSDNKCSVNQFYKQKIDMEFKRIRDLYIIDIEDYYKHELPQNIMNDLLDVFDKMFESINFILLNNEISFEKMYAIDVQLNTMQENIISLFSSWLDEKTKAID